MMISDELLIIADTIDRDGGWHIAAVKIRAFSDKYAALESSLAAAQAEVKRLTDELAGATVENSELRAIIEDDRGISAEIILKRHRLGRGE